MKTYRIVFQATVSRDVEVPNDLDWSEAYEFVRCVLGWDTLAHSAAARVDIDTSRTQEFKRVWVEDLRDG